MSDIDPNATGGQLRTQLESTLADNRTMREELAALKAKDIIATEGFITVKPEDLKGVALDELPAKAKEIHETRMAERTALAREMLEAQGHQGAELDRLVDQYVQGKPSVHPDAGATARARATGGGGTPPPLVNPEGLSAREKLREGLKRQGQARK